MNPENPQHPQHPHYPPYQAAGPDGSDAEPQGLPDDVVTGFWLWTAALPLALWLRLRSLRRRPPGAPLALPPRSHGQHRRPYLVSSAPASASKPSRPGPQRGYRPPSNTFDADKRHRR